MTQTTDPVGFGWPAVIVAALMFAAWLYLHTELPRHADRIGEAYRMRLRNQGRRKTDRGGYQQVDADPWPLDFEWPEDEGRAA